MAKAVLDSSPPPCTPSSRPAAPQPLLHHPEGCQMGVHPQLLHSRQLPARCRTPPSRAQALGARPLLPCPTGGPDRRWADLEFWDLAEEVLLMLAWLCGFSECCASMFGTVWRCCSLSPCAWPSSSISGLPLPRPSQP